MLIALVNVLYATTAMFGQSLHMFISTIVFVTFYILRPNSDLSQTSHCNIKGLSVREVMRVENMITQSIFY